MTYKNKNWPKKPTPADFERMEKAHAKRERRKAKRLQETAVRKEQ